MQDSVSRRQLASFMRRAENQDLVAGGLQQVSEFRQTLITCISGDNNSM